MTGQYITTSLKCTPNFIGCFAQDELENLTITSFPSFLIVNIDSSESQGSHWIAIGIFTERIEIFDSLGFDIFNWTQVPCTLLTFLHRLSVSRRVFTVPRVQTFECFSSCFNTNDIILERFFKNAT